MVKRSRMMPKRQKHVILGILLASGALVYFLFITKFGDDDPAGSAPSLLPEKYSLRSMETHEDALLSLVKTIDINDFKTVLKPFLVQRVVGTSGHENVKNYIIDEFKNLKWDVELDSFVDVTPDKRKLTFTNIVTTYKADAPRLLVLACHYDSKLFDFEFIGATDSAVPCAMLVYLAKNLDGVLQNLPSTMGLQLIFFDGEEAFINWSARDSLYGSRHLANVLEKKAFDKARNINHLKRMDLLVLLDLIGASSPEFYSYFENTNKWHSLVITIERQLLAKGLLEGDLENNRYKPYFLEQTFYGALIDDDHRPFHRKGVPVMHVIPYPFPNVWHTEADNESAVNYKTVNNLLKIFKIFTIQYLVNAS